MAPQILSLLTFLLLQLPFRHNVMGLSLPKRNDQYSMNQNGITWDASCNDANPQNTQETRRAAVERAWAGALELVSTTWTRFDTETWPTVKEGHLNSVAQQHVNAIDPGYVLFFALDSSSTGTEKIQTILKNLAQRLNSNPGSNNRPSNTRISISCRDSFIEDGEDECDFSAASTISVANEDSSTINFCPEFWERPRFDQLKASSKDVVRTYYHSGNYGGTDAHTVMHEATHLWWVGPTNERIELEEEYGLVECADLAWSCTIPDNDHVLLNADTYAWYGEYGYFVYKGVTNLWPPSHSYPVVLPVQNY